MTEGSHFFPTPKDRLRMALAEAGYPDVIIEGGDEDPLVHMGRGTLEAPNQVVWKAFNVAGYHPQPCYICWAVGHGEDCARGTCHADDADMPLAEECYD